MKYRLCAGTANVRIQCLFKEKFDCAKAGNKIKRQHVRRMSVFVKNIRVSEKIKKREGLILYVGLVDR